MKTRYHKNARHNCAYFAQQNYQNIKDALRISFYVDQGDVSQKLCQFCVVARRISLMIFEVQTLNHTTWGAVFVHQTYVNNLVKKIHFQVTILIASGTCTNIRAIARPFLAVMAWKIPSLRFRPGCTITEQKNFENLDQSSNYLISTQLATWG